MTEKNTTDATVIAEWPLNNRETLRVMIETFKGHPLIGIRKWYRAEDGNLRPTRDGIALNVRHLPALAGAVGRALVEAKAKDLIRDEGAIPERRK